MPRLSPPPAPSSYTRIFSRLALIFAAPSCTAIATLYRLCRLACLATRRAHCYAAFSRAYNARLPPRASSAVRSRILSQPPLSALAAPYRSSCSFSQRSARIYLLNRTIALSPASHAPRAMPICCRSALACYSHNIARINITLIFNIITTYRQRNAHLRPCNVTTLAAHNNALSYR